MRWSIALLSILFVLPKQSAAESNPADPDESLFRCLKPKGNIKIEFKAELELGELVSWASAFSCEAIVVASPIANRKLSVNIIAPKKMSSRSAWRLFGVALRAMNMAMVRGGGAYVIVEAPTGKGHPLPLVKKATAHAGMVRSVVSAEFLTASELSSIVSALKSKAGDVKVLDGTDMVLVTDYSDHIAKMAELLEEVDRGHAENEGIYVIPVVHADVAELGATIEAILGAGKPVEQRRTTKGKSKAKASTPVTAKGPRAIIAEPRTRSIIVVASKAAHSRARSLIKRLDVATGEQSSHIHMIALEHADAETLAGTLTALMGARAEPKQAAGGARQARQPSAAITVEGDVRVTHDAPTNALLVLATMQDFLSLREIIRRLDTTRPQVYIEATIMEVSVTGDRDLGGSFHLGGENGGGTWLAGLQQSDLQSTNLSTLVGAAGLLGGIFGSPLTGLESFGIGQSIPSFGILFQALATSRRANLLSSPRIMTSDNTPATLKVSEKRRELGGTTTVATGGTTQSVVSVDASLTLKVTPHVNATDEVKLEIELVLEEFLPSRSEALGSDTSSREITNTVVVRDQESVIIGGLLVEREVRTESKIPLLGDIPILGYLFKSTGLDKEKRNLVVLLTPYVLDSRADHDHIVRRAMQERAEFMKAHFNLRDAKEKQGIDYRKKRGLLETINQRAKAIEAEKSQLDALSRKTDEPEASEGPF